MASLNCICILIVVFTFSQSSNGKEESQWKTLQLIRKNGWDVKADQFDNPTFVYALCENEPLVNSKRECMIVLHEDVHNNDAEPKQCTFTLENASNGIIRIENFGTDRAIVVWSHETEKNEKLHWTFRMAVVQMSSCQIADTELVVSANSEGWEYGDVGWHTFHIGILVYENTFDVVVQRAEACGDADDDSHCVYTYNGDGKRIGGPITRFSPEDDEEYYQLKPSSRDSSVKGYLLIVVGNAPYVSMLKPKDTKVVSKLLWKLPANKGDQPVTSYSWNNEMIAMCSCQVLGDKISCLCMQMHEDGRSKRQMEFAVKKSAKASSMIVFLHNIRGGGFFLVPLYSDDKEYFYSMSKMSANGRVAGEPIVIAKHSRSCNPEPVNTRIIEREDGQYCITVACVEEDGHGKVLKTLTKCYTPTLLEWKFHARDRVEL